MKGYKGFNPDFTCRGKQYAENTVFEEPGAEICKSGMHFCENPFDVLKHYGFVNDRGEINEFAEVEALDEPKTDYGKKYTSKKLKIGAKIGIDGLVKAFVDMTIEKPMASGNAPAENDVDQRAATNTGDQSAATNTGDQSAATNTGDQSAATNTGYRSAATNTGYQSAATNTGYRSAATNTGRWSAATNTGDQSAAANTGRWSAALNVGDEGTATAGGKDSFAINTGFGGKVRGKIGCYIAAAEWDTSGGERKLIDFRAVKVDGESIKEDVYYKLVNGEFVEAKTDD